MLNKSKSKAPNVRKNRRKKNSRRGLWTAYALLGLKLTALMGVVLGASAVFMIGYAAVIRSDYFRAEAILISGQQRLERQDILDQAAVGPGDNLLAINLRLVRQRLLNHPWIASARVSRQIPETIRIEITEHEPFARIDWGRRFMIDENGRIFKEAGPHDSQDLPLISGITIDDVSSEPDRLSPAMQSVMQVLRLARRRGSAIAYADIERLEMDPELGVTLILKDQRRIKLGLDAYETKYDRFQRLRRELERRRDQRVFQVVDLSIPDRVVVRPGGDGAKG